MLAPVFDVQQKLLELERSQGRSAAVPMAFQPQHVRVLNAPRMTPESPANAGQNDDERPSEASVREVMRLAGMGWGKQAIIEKVWGVKPGGSLRYRQAEAEYETIMQNNAEEA